MDIENLLKKVNMEELQCDVDKYQYQSYFVPRVTEIISSMIHEDFLNMQQTAILPSQRKMLSSGVFSTDFSTADLLMLFFSVAKSFLISFSQRFTMNS